MKQEKRGKIKVLFFGIFLLSTLITIGGYNFTFIKQIDNEFQERIFKITGSYNEYSTNISGDAGWAWIEANKPWCSGSGTWNDPYTIENVTFNANGLYVPGKSALRIENSHKVFIIRNCTFGNSSIDFAERGSVFNAGIYLDNVHNGTIQNNTILDNSLGIYTDNSCKNISIIENKLYNNTAHAIFLSGANFTILDNIMVYSGIRIPGYDLVGNGLTNAKSHVIDTTNILDNKPVYYIVNQSGFDSSTITNPGQIIVVNTNYTSFSNLDMQGGSIAFQLIYSNHNSISNNHYSYFNKSQSAAIRVDGSYNNTIIGNNISHNNVGIIVEHSDQTLISGNNISYNTHGINGYRIFQSDDNNTIKNNNLFKNTNEGINLDTTDNWLVQGNQIVSNNSIGILIAKSNKCQIVGNTLNSDGINETYTSVGIAASQLESISTYNDIIGNNISYYGIGIALVKYNEFFNISLNNITNNVNYGIRILQNNDNNIITYNNITNNGDYSIHLVGSDSCTISNNNASSNNETGIHVVNCDNTDILNNYVSKNTEYGIYLDQSANCKINYNTLANNGICIGVHQDSCPNLETIGNTCEGNTYNYTPLDPTDGNGGPPPFPIELVIGVIVIVGIVGVITIYLLRRKRT